MVYSQNTPRGFAAVDVGHWSRVCTERRRLGIPANKAGYGRVPDHPLMGMTLVDRKGQAYVVESVTRDWHAGWFLAVMLRTAEGNICGTRVLSNESSLAPFVQRQADEFFVEFVTQQ